MLFLDQIYEILVTSSAHAIFFMIILSILYFTVIIKIEKKILTNFIVDGCRIYELDKLPIYGIPKYNLIKTQLEKLAEKEEEGFKDANKKLYFKTVKIIFVIFIILAIILGSTSYFLRVKQVQLNYKKILLEVCVLILVVGVFDFLYVKYIVLSHAFYSFSEFGYQYIVNNAKLIYKYLPSIIIHFLSDFPQYASLIPSYITEQLKSQVKHRIINTIKSAF